MRSLFAILLYCLCFTSSRAQDHSYDLSFTHVTGNVYTYVSYGSFDGQRYAANAVYLVTKDGVVLFDTPWDKEYFQPLLDSIWQRHHQKVIMCLSTHFHEDRTAGLTYYAAKGIRTFTTRQTDSLCVLNHNPRATFMMPKDTVFHVGGEVFQVYYPGPGHSADNLVIWLPEYKVLYGGCLIKSTDVNSLGNLEDANVAEWGQSLKRMERKFPHPDFIIVGHESWKNKQSIKHTLDLLAEYQEGQGR